MKNLFFAAIAARLYAQAKAARGQSIETVTADRAKDGQITCEVRFKSAPRTIKIEGKIE